MHQAETDTGERASVTSAERERVKALEREMKKLRSDLGLASASAPAPSAQLPILVIVPCNTSHLKMLRRPIESAQYISIHYSGQFKEASIKPSVGSVDDSYDIALTETINGLYKAEVIHRQPWKSLEAVELATWPGLIGSTIDDCLS